MYSSSKIVYLEVDYSVWGSSMHCKIKKTSSVRAFMSSFWWEYFLSTGYGSDSQKHVVKKPILSFPPSNTYKQYDDAWMNGEDCFK